MSLTLELLRMETDRDLFWPYSAGNGLISAVPHDCPKAAKKANVTNSSNQALVNNNNNNNNNSLSKVRAGLSTHKRHSYYECCVNVEVSALLEHWLGWDHHHHSDQSELVSDSASPMPTSWADRLVSHLVEEAPIPTDKNSTDHPISIWVRKFCSEIGCDVLKKQDNNGKTLLHHLLSGAVKRNLVVTARILIEAGIAVDTRDLNGDTPLLLIKNLITELATAASTTSSNNANVDEDSSNSNSDYPNSNSDYPNSNSNSSCSSSPTSEVCDLIMLLVVEHHASLDALDAKGRSLLTYAVEAGDRCLAITRLLINLGAKTFSDQLGNEAGSSAFAWFLRAQMRKIPKGQNFEILDLDEDSLYVLGTAIIAEAHDLGFKAIVDRTMVALGTSREVHGPLFRRLRGLLAPYWLQPLQLRQLAVHSLRRSLGPKRLSTTNKKGHNAELMMSARLKVPLKLQRYIMLEEKIPASK